MARAPEPDVRCGAGAVDGRGDMSGGPLLEPFAYELRPAAVTAWLAPAGAALPLPVPLARLLPPLPPIPPGPAAPRAAALWLEPLVPPRMSTRN
jgi:hypothetical protein